MKIKTLAILLMLSSTVVMAGPEGQGVGGNQGGDVGVMGPPEGAPPAANTGSWLNPFSWSWRGGQPTPGAGEVPEKKFDVSEPKKVMRGAVDVNIRRMKEKIALEQRLAAAKAEPGSAAREAKISSLQSSLFNYRDLPDAPLGAAPNFPPMGGANRPGGAMPPREQNLGGGGEGASGGPGVAPSPAVPNDTAMKVKEAARREKALQKQREMEAAAREKDRLEQDRLLLAQQKEQQAQERQAFEMERKKQEAAQKAQQERDRLELDRQKAQYEEKMRALELKQKEMEDQRAAAGVPSVVSPQADMGAPGGFAPPPPPAPAFNAPPPPPMTPAAPSPTISGAGASQSGENRGALLEQIQGGTTLKKAEDRKLAPLPEKNETPEGLIGILEKNFKGRRAAIGGSRQFDSPPTGSGADDKEWE